MSSGYPVPLPEEMAARLSELPLFRQRIMLEHAINRALDEVGWPRGMRGTIDVPVSYWYVIVFRHGQLKGHVGPIPDEDKARRAAASWRGGGDRATVSRRPVGPALTNAHE